jgi:Flp pilus assembly protein TadD
MVDKALAQDMIFNGSDSKPYLLLSKLEVQKNNFAKASEILTETLKLNKTDATVWAEIG